MSTAAEELMPLLSYNGDYLFFSRMLCDENVGGKFGGSDVWSSKRSQSWIAPTSGYFPWNDRDNNVVIGTSANGKTLYLMNSQGGRKTKGIYFSRSVSGAWTKPELIPVDGINHSTSLGFYMAPAEDVLLISMRGEDSKGEEDIYVSLKDRNGNWSQPKNLGPSINTIGYEISPFLSDDKNRLYFASNGHGGQGDVDIFYCDRLYGSWETWSSPRNLGPEVNTKGFDAYFSVYGDSIAYFSRAASGKPADLYSSKVEIVKSAPITDARNFLLPADVNALLGSDKVQRSFEFDRGVVDLTTPQRELLWFIANKILDTREIKLYLIAYKRSEDLPNDTYERRILSMVNHMQLAGVDFTRITFSIEIMAKDEPASKPESVEIRFYK
ncbi:MAG: hypothetical protein HC859_06310 [Bacteroidia bacterium]|nr:hypothetical protein [Bacteroidia bacterium]